ncbi:MAG TPA: hypothetical protein VIL66_07575 [Bacillota bacterium]
MPHRMYIMRSGKRLSLLGQIWFLFQFLNNPKDAGQFGPMSNTKKAEDSRKIDFAAKQFPVGKRAGWAK